MGLEAWKLAISGSKSNGMRGLQSGKGTSRGQKKGDSEAKNSKSKAASVSRSKRKKNRRDSSEVTGTFDEKKWRAESDLRALTEANEVLESPERVKAAKKIAQERAEVARAAAESIDNL